MDRDSELALTVLRSIAFCQSSMRDLENRLRDLPQVSKVTHWFELTDQDCGVLIEEYVGAELSSGKGVDWGLVITLSSSGWDIQADVSVSHERGQDVLTSFPAGPSSTLAQAISEIRRLVSALTGTQGLIESAM